MVETSRTNLDKSLESLNIYSYMTTEQTVSSDEDPVIQSKAPRDVLKKNKHYKSLLGEMCVAGK